MIMTFPVRGLRPIMGSIGLFRQFGLPFDIMAIPEIPVNPPRDLIADAAEPAMTSSSVPKNDAVSIKC